MWFVIPMSAPARVTPEGADESQFAILHGNTRPEAVPANDRGRVAEDQPLSHLMLLLKRAPEQEQALQQFIQEIHDPASPQFHHWIRAEEFGKRFGASSADVARVTSWLGSQGFKINVVYENQTIVDFTGTVGQVQQAFQVEIHHLQVNGETHIANMSDPQIPAELAGTVAGIVSLNDFRPQKMVTKRADYSPGNGQYPVAPADLWTIYNFLPAFAQGYSGQNQTIVVLEDTDLYSTADWSTFRSTFKLASAYPGGALVQVNPPSTPVNNCVDPGVNGNDDEAILDAEWASAAAPSATIEVASCLDTITGFGGFLALENLLNASVAPPAIVSISYGEPEPSLGATYNAFISSLYEQAVAEGVSVFVSSGDSGAASADRGAQAAQYGINISGFTSTPYNVSVGGTDFADTYQGEISTYWNTANALNYGSALSYVPEVPWNDSCASVLLADWQRILPTYGPTGSCSQAANIEQGRFLNTTAGGGGPSGCASGAPVIAESAGGTCAGYPKPAWQSGLLGNPSDGVRDVPDVSLFAGNGIWNHYYPACFSDTNNGGKSCSGTPDTWSGYGGTSIAAPIWAGIQSLVNQATASRWGNPNPTYYALAANQYSGSSACSSPSGNQIGNGCIFNDVTQIPLLYGGAGMGGDTDLPCAWQNCYQPSGSYGVLSTAPQAINYLQLRSLGSGYSSAPACYISGGGGTGAACAATLTGVVSSVTLTNQGSGYTSTPICTLTGGGGTGAACNIGLTVSDAGGSWTGWVSSVGILSYGSGYTSAPTCTISGGGGTGATCSAAVTSGVTISLTAGGSGYTTMPGCTLTGGGGSGATCMALGTSDSDAYQPAFNAGVGWDFATGIGTVNASNLVANFASFGASVSPTSLVFQPQALKTASAAQTVTLTNTGAAALTILSATFSGTDPLDFASSADTCTRATLKPNGTCTVNVTFTPTYVGSRSASLNFSDAARPSQNTVTLSGTGIGAGASLSPATIVFPTQIIGASATQTLTLTNPGTLALALNGIAIQANSGGTFTQTSTCGPTLQPQSQCMIDVTYTPGGPGGASATLQVTDNALDSPQTVSLTGSGAVPAPLINQPLVPASIAPGGPDFILAVAGTGFAPGATVNWNGTALMTTYVSSEKLQASVPAANIASRGSAAITVANPGTALVSNAILLPIMPFLPALAFADSPGSPIAVETNPQSVVVGDFRGIGRTDLAVANVVSDNVTILLSNGDGTFTKGASSPILVGTFPVSIAAGDFNGDGKLDLVTANAASENLTILLGNGNGTFTPLAESPATGIEPLQVVAGDFNGDGKLDLAVAIGSSNGVQILLGNGDGTFTPVPAVSATGSAPVAMAVGDFNGDGKLDLAVANEYSHSVTILLGNGDGTFTAAASAAVGTYPMAIAADDFNGDGKLDLAVANMGDNNLTILLGNGDGTFRATASPATEVGPTGIGVGDFNGDGKLDLAVINTISDNVSILVGNGDGTFTPSASIPRTGQSPEQIAVGDFNGDGQLDLVTANYGTNNISVLLQQQPALWVSVLPATLNFGNQNVGTSSVGQSITLSNFGTTALTIDNIGIGGTNPGDFAQTNTCGSSVAAGGSCTITVTFKPTASGARSASVSVSDNAFGSPQTAPLSGTGEVITPTVTVTPGASGISTTQGLSVTVAVSGGTGNPKPTGSVTLSSGSYSSAATTLNSGSATIAILALSLPSGTDTLSVAYSGDSIYSATTGKGSVIVMLSVASVAIAPGNNGMFDSSQSEEVTVALAGAGPVPTGTVMLSGGGYASASTTLNAGSTMIAIPANQFTTAGNITLTANYSGDAVYASSSGTSTITVNAPYSLATTTPSAIAQGSNASATITLSADPSYSGTVTVACALASSPTGAQDLPSCTVASGSPVTITNGTAGGPAMVTITTTAASSVGLDRRGLPGWSGAGGATVLALLVFLGIPGYQRSWRNLLGLVLLMVVLGTLAACGGAGGGGGGSGGNLGTTAGNYTFTITATGNPGINPAPTVALRLTVN